MNLSLTNLIILIALCISTFCSHASASDDQEFRLGVLLCLTGECAEWGNNSLQAIKMAADEINSDGGVLGRKIKLVVQDTQEYRGGAYSVAAYRKLILDEQISYIIGTSWSVGGLPIAPLVAKAKNLIITSPSVGVAQFNETGDNIFNTWPHDEISSRKLAQFAVVKKGFKTAAILSRNEPWVQAQSDSFADEFVKLGGKILFKADVNSDTQNPQAECLRVKMASPDVVFYSDYYSMAAGAKELNKLKYEGEKFATLVDKSRLEAAGGALDGTFFTKYEEPSADFRNAFKKLYGVEPGIAADTAYDTLRLYADAITTANTFDVNKVKTVLAGMEFKGASGRIVFDKHGGVIREPLVWRVAGNDTEVVK